MNEQFNSSYFVEKTDRDANGPEVNSDPSAGEAPVDAAPVQELPLVETVAVVDPQDESIVHEASMGEPIPNKPPMSETVANEFVVSESIPSQAPVSEAITHEASIGTNAGSSAALLSREESEHYRTRWNEIQGKFVDEPRSAVQQADALVSEVIEQITQMFANEHSSLEGQWNQGNDVSTEDLRKALQHYRSFFNRLVV
jgi:hypothetical protein